MAGRWRTRLGILSAATVLASGLTACGGSSTASGTPTLNWYINPDNGGQQKIAADCSAASNGAYDIEVSILPSDAAASVSSSCGAWRATTPRSTS